MLIFSTQLQAEDISTLEKQCNSNPADKCTELGLARVQIMHDSPDGFNSKNMDKIIPLFKKACEATDMKGCSLLGHLYIKQGKTSKGVKVLVDACDKKSDIACAELSLHYYNDGNYIKKEDNLKSRFYLTKACNLGDERSCGAQEILITKEEKVLSKGNIKVIEAVLLNNKSLLPKTTVDFSHIKHILSNKDLFDKIGNSYKPKTDFKIYEHKVLYLNLVGIVGAILGPNATLVGTPKDVAMSISKKYNIKFELEKSSGDYFKELGNNLVVIITHHRNIENASFIILTTIDDPYH